MNYLEGREAIQKMLNKYPNCKHRQGVIDQVLWCVAKGEGVEYANALIRLFDLEMFGNGSHNYFICDKTGVNYHCNRYPHLVTSPDDYRGASKKDNSEIEDMIKTGVK